MLTKVFPLPLFFSKLSLVLVAWGVYGAFTPFLCWYLRKGVCTNAGIFRGPLSLSLQLACGQRSLPVIPRTLRAFVGPTFCNQTDYFGTCKRRNSWEAYSFSSTSLPPSFLPSASALFVSKGAVSRISISGASACLAEKRNVKVRPSKRENACGGDKNLCTAFCTNCIHTNRQNTIQCICTVNKWKTMLLCIIEQ